ncbi:hypothetical protein BJY17_001700 [Agromyces hippuratus]|uniref:Uncharacterized protein n=1 Tax=Agromyces hippuratus TaxID=286438 RepID=A0A852WYF2_9MICO|nr:hypothetical protein [Agromyces hippuratus]NYG20953.1 hypothetical protein [Agromyces hippuratus]
MLDAATARFIEQVAALPAEELATIFDESLNLWMPAGRAASEAIKISAAENSELDHDVREALRPLTAELDAHVAGLHSDAKSATVMAARAVQTRATLTAEHYEVLVAPFIAAGVEVPPHPGRL